MVDSIETFESGRRFQVWHYSVSHSQLLLRSNPDDNYSTRVEVLFKGVERLEIPTSLNGLNIRTEEGRFKLNGEDWSGQIKAVAMFSAEDQGQYTDPSTLFIEGL